MNITDEVMTQAKLALYQVRMWDGGLLVRDCQLADSELEEIVKAIAPIIREIALREAAEVAEKGSEVWRMACDKLGASKTERRDYQTMAIACMHVQGAILALLKK